ncbi:MAG: vWA domain-containing protein [Kofleriaceae bacterium]
MITRQRIVSFGIPTVATATILTAALLHAGKTPRLVPTSPLEPVSVIPSHVVGDKHQIDVVFAVDTTGSMGGLLDGAKRTVWSIASHIKKTDPNADIRIGLVAYRDVGDEYVTRPFSLTNDLDAVYGELSGYQAAGGGDTPEDVDAALDDSLHKMQWRPSARKLIFVVGDAAPASRGEVPTYDVGAREAATRGITINTIRCGWDTDTQTAFQRIAQIGGGEFSTIQQDGGVQQVATPFDAELATLSSEVDGTAVIVGDEGVRGAYHAKMEAAKAAPAAAKADRAGYYAKGGMGRSKEDLVGGVATGTMTIDEVDQTTLPADMQGMDKAQVKQEVEKRVAQRKQLQTKIETLTKQREEFLSKQAKDGEGGFDAKVKETVEKQIK